MYKFLCQMKMGNRIKKKTNASCGSDIVSYNKYYCSSLEQPRVQYKDKIVTGELSSSYDFKFCHIMTA